jgi:hypothetical protein
MMIDNEFRSHINTIISANRNKMLALFIGAGISKTSDAPSNKLPNWSELIEKLKRELNETKEQDFLKIAQLYYLTFGEYKYHNTVKKHFPDTIEPSIIHEMIFDLNPEIIITTNWDTILENAIKKQGYLYDVISSDAELVKSTLPRKLIKMHGDFSHQNFVFKEEDYISYSDHFPLIENYIKGILTTHTVVFLGYSYNDMDIKHIIKWIQNRSDCRPPMFLTEFYNNPSHKRYLESFGITTLVLKEKSGSLLNPYSKRIHRFLEILNTKDFIYKVTTAEDIIQYIYNRVTILDDLNNILFTQIESLFSYSKVIFGEDFPILEFFLDVRPKEKDKETREIYRQFIETIKCMRRKDDPKYIMKNEKLEAIFEILNRAGIKSILLDVDEKGNEDYIDFGDCFVSGEPDFFENIIGFNYSDTSSDLTDPIMKMIDSAFILYQQEQYEKIIPLLDEIIAECRSRRRWILLFIAMHNKNIILRHIRYFLFSNKYDSLKEYDLTEEYEKLPEEIKITVAPIYDFLQFNDLYKLFFSLSRDLTEKEGHIKTRKSGGIVFGSDGGKNSRQQENLLRFVIGNKIMIENYREYRDIHRKILSIRFTEQALDNTIEMSRIELYAAIKYFDNRALKELFRECLPDNENDDYKKITVNDDDKKWLVKNVFVNILDQYLNSKYVFSAIETHIRNTLFLMSFVEFDESVINFILDKINNIVACSRNSINIYEEIELFLGLQYELFLPDFDANLFVKIIGSVIGKIIKREWNIYERYSFTNNGLRNIFGYAKKQQAVFVDEKAIRQIILEISDFREKEKKQIVSTILLNIFLIGSDTVKQIIKDYVLTIDNSMNIDSNIIFELNLDIVGLKKLDEIVIEKIGKYLAKYEVATQYNGYAAIITKLIIDMYEHRENDDIKNLYNRAKKIAEDKKKMTYKLFERRDDQ